MRILLIEDNLQLSEQLTEALTSYHYTVDVAVDGQEGWDLMQLVDYDLILLDVVLPKIDGINVCRQLRAQGSTVPILLLTGRSTSEDKIFGLDAGADDYLTKPIGLGELNARIRALLRRGRAVTPPILEWGELRFDPSTCRVTYGGILLNLTPKEQNLLELFLRQGQRVHSRKAILEHLWALEGDFPGEDTVKAHVKGLRHKLHTVGAKDLIETVYGLGYRLNTAYLKSQSLTKDQTQEASKAPEQAAESGETAHANSSAIAQNFHHPLLLIVGEDQEFTRHLTLEAKTWGIETTAVADLKIADDLLMQACPDVALLDLDFLIDQQNNINWLTHLSEAFPKLPVLVSTDRDRTSERLAVVQSEAKGFLQKTTPPNQVMEAITQVLRHQDNPERAVILAVDDDAVTLKLLHTLFTHHGIQITTLKGAEQFWEALELVQPNLVILDSQMPDVNGIELCKMLRNDLQWNWLPVLFLTATTDSQTIQDMFAAGADDYATKPIVLEELVTRVQNRLKRVRTLRDQGKTDVLTGIDNRQRGAQELERLFRLAKRSQQPFCVAVLELDHLKLLNQKYGHGMGDRVLCQVGQLLRRELRREDIVARWGGAAFVVGIYGMHRYEGIECLAAILEKLRGIEFSSLTGQAFHVSFSAGIAEYPGDGDALFVTLHAAAEAALDAAKGAGGDRIFPAHRPTEPSQITMPEIILIHPDSGFAQSIQLALETRGYFYHWIKDGQSALQQLSGKTSLRASVILLADEMADMSGLEILNQLAHRKITQVSRVIWLSHAPQEVELAMKLGAFDYADCPCDGAVLMQHVQKGLLTMRA